MLPLASPNSNNFQSSFKLSQQTKITHIPEPANASSNYWLNCILLSNKQKRDEFLKYTNENGIMTRPVWELMNCLPIFHDAECGDLSNAEWCANRLVNIPSSTFL